MSDKDPSVESVPGDPLGSDPSEDDRALYEDLSAYENCEVFYDPSLNLLPRFRISSKLLTKQKKPDVLRVEIEGENLLLTIREAAFLSVRQNREKRGERHDERYWSDVRAAMLANQGYLEASQEMFYFFVRYFPQLIIRIYDLAIQASVVYGAVYDMKDPEKRKAEQGAKKAVEQHARSLGNDIKRMLGTHSSGRPRRVESEPLPKIVTRVLDAAWQMMGNLRGKDAVPGLKEIAIKLDTNEGALSRRLSREDYPWTKIRTFLEGLPGDET